MNIKQYRKKKNLTLEAFGDLVGLKPHTIWYYENGRVPKPAIIKRIKEVTKNWITEKDFYNDET